MLHRAFYSRVVCASIFPFYRSSSDMPLNGQPEKVVPGEIFLEKFKRIFDRTDGQYTPELMVIMNSTSAGLIGGGLLGGIIKGRLALETFVKENHATKFKSQADAQRQMQYKFMLDFFRGGARLGIQVGTFCCLFTSASTCFYVHTGKYNVSNFTFAGAITGCLFKLNMGIKGAIAGTVVGGVLGWVYGCINQVIVYLSGVEIEDVYSKYTKQVNEGLIKYKQQVKNAEENPQKVMYETHLEKRKEMGIAIESNTEV